MRKIAITGTLGAGKSTVCQILADSGAFIIDADKIAHQLILDDCRQDIIQLLGPEIITDGEIDRQKVADIVFNNGKKLTSLEEILHPHILKKIKDTIENIQTANTHSLFVAEIPLLFECNWQKLFDLTICVTRQQKPDKPEWKKRMNYQMIEEEKAKNADIILTNDGTYNDLKSQIQNLKLGA